LELQNFSRSIGLSRHIEYGVDSNSALMAAMREVGLVKPSSGITNPEDFDGVECGNEDMEPLPPFLIRYCLR
jgi:hypothetical protein